MAAEHVQKGSGKAREFLALLNLISEIEPRHMEQDRCLVPAMGDVMDVMAR